MEFTKELKEEIFNEIVNDYAPTPEAQKKKTEKALWIAQCILRDEEESCEMIDFEGEDD